MEDRFPDLPEDMYQYENQFSYAVWTPDTSITMMTVPWRSNYLDVVQFDSDEAKSSYFASRRSVTLTLTGYVYLRYGQPVRVNVPYNTANRYNYLVVRNPRQPVPDPSGAGYDGYDTFYYFINDIRYIAPNTTELQLQLDVWTTYWERCSLGLSYFSQGHGGIVNQNLTPATKRTYLLEPEGLDIGQEYDIPRKKFFNFNTDTQWAVVLCTADLTANPGTLDAPNLETAKGCIVDGVPEGSECYLLDFDDFEDFMTQMQVAPWVSQCVTYISYLPGYFVTDPGDAVKLFGNAAGVTMYKPHDDTFSWQAMDFFDQLTPEIMALYPERYRHLTKFATSPYSMLELTALVGGTVMLKPECCPEQLRIEVVGTPAPPSARYMIYPKDYNTENGALYEGGAEILVGGEDIDLAVTVSSFPQFSLVNNEYQLYLASTVNARNYVFTAADWSRDRLLAEMNERDYLYNAQREQNTRELAASNTYANRMMTQSQLEAESSLNYGLAMAQREQDASAWGAIGLGIGSGLSLNFGGVGQAIEQGVTAGPLADQMRNALQQRNEYANQLAQGQRNATINLNTAQTNAAQEYLGAQMDANRFYSNYIAQNDYKNTIQGLQAQVADSKLLQPSVSGQNGGETFNLSNDLYGCAVKVKIPKDQYIHQVGDFWLRFGYRVNRWVVPPEDFRLMDKFTYWKFAYATVTGDAPSTFIDTIRGILESGTTIWNDPADMYVTDLADNHPRVEWGY